MFIGQFHIKKFIIEQFVIGQLNTPITSKVVVTCVRARFGVFGAWLPVGGAVTLECLRLLCQSFNANFPFVS